MIFRYFKAAIKFRKYKILYQLNPALALNKNYQVFNRNFSFSSRFCKLYIQHENEYAHSVMSKAGNYNLFEPLVLSKANESFKIEDILKNCKDKSTEEVYENFKIITKYCHDNNICISDNRFNDFVDEFTEKCYNFSDSQLFECFKYMKLLPETPSIYCQNLIELWSALDDETSSRLEKWKSDQILYVCELWYSLNLAKKSNFVWLALRKLGRKIKKFNKNEIVHSLFICNLVRKPPVSIVDYESAWMNHFKDMSIEEISVTSMGFFKTATRIGHPELINMIYKRLMKELNNIEDITLVNILKILRYSSKIPQADILSELMDKLCTIVHKVSLLSCLHIALMGCEMQFSHDDCIHLILERFYKEIDTTRLKDLERIAHVMSLFNVPNKNGIKDNLSRKILDELPKRINEIVVHPKSFAACLHYLTLCGHYDDEFINAVLDPRFLRHAYGNNLLLERDIFCLDSYTRINLAGKYSGNQLTDRNRATMGKLLTHYIPERNSKFKLQVTDRILLEVAENVQEIVKICSIKHILPHFQRPDIVIGFDKENKEFLKLGNYCEDYKGVLLTKNNMFDTNIDVKNIETIAIILNGWNNHVRNKERLTGSAEMKLKQLELLEYKTILLPWWEWRELESKNDRQKYLKRKLFQHIKF